jgi:dihydroorotase
MKILIKNGTLADPAQNICEPLDIATDNGRIARIGKALPENGATVIDAQGKMVLPGLVDMHVHLREPGREDKETIVTGTRAALKGGVTTVLAMPNTTPAIDGAAEVRLFRDLIAKKARARVLIAGALTKGRLGEEPVDVAALKSEGVSALTDDGNSVDDPAIMEHVLRAAKREGLVVICHCEDKALSANGVVNLGFVSTALGLRGISKESEYRRVARDLELARETGACVHIAHVSCRESVDLVAQAKAQGVRVTAETAPHYLALTEDDLMSYDTNLKMNPPLRTREDLQALKEALRTGVLDVIASDHAPHAENEKEIEFDRAEFGVTGLETMLALCVTELVEPGFLDWPGLARKLALNPAKVLGVERGALAAGAAADIIVVDPKREWRVAKDDFASMSKNSAFLGRTLKGAVEHVVLDGEIVFPFKRGRAPIDLLAR